MKTLFKISFGLLIFVFIAVIGFALTFNPNDYKDDIITLVKENTGRQLSIPGDISLSLFPWIGLELGKIEISNARGFSKKTFAKMAHLQVRAKFWPLFQQRLEADTLVIEGLTLNLEKNKQGKSNWDDLLQSKKETISPETKTHDNKKPKANILAAFAINGIKINQSQFNFDDQQLKQKTSIKNVQLEIGQLKPNTPIPFYNQFEIQQAELLAKINFTNNITFSSNFEQFSFHDLKLNADLKLPTFKKNQNITLSSKLITLDLNNQKAKSDNLMLAINEAKLRANFVAKNILSKPNVKAKLNIETLNPRIAMENINIALPAMADNNALTKFGAKLDIFASSKKIALSKINITLDDSLIKGKATVNLPSASNVNLNINTINLDRYLPPPAKGKSKNKQTKQPKAIEAALIPVALLTKVDLAANIKIKKLQIKKTHWKNLHLVSNAKNGIVDIKPLKLQGYGSTINSSLQIKAIKNNASLFAKLNIQNIKSGEILKDFMDVKNLQGLTSVKADIRSTGVKLTQLKQNLNGKVRFNLKEGIIKGFDLEYEINKLDAKIKRKPEPAKPSPLQTKFTNLSASALIKNGVIHNKDLRAATPFTRVIGRGSINIAKEQLNYVATVKLTSSRDIKSNKSFEKMNSIPLDVHIRGTFDKPQIKADFSKALKTLAKKEVKKHEQKLKKKAKDKLKEKLEDKLKKLLRF